MEYLDHVGLGHVPRLTRVEWGVIRRYSFLLWKLNKVLSVGALLIMSC